MMRWLVAVLLCAMQVSGQGTILSAGGMLICDPVLTLLMVEPLPPQPNVLLILSVAIVGFMAICGLPMWWFMRGRKAGERREKRWGAILLGVLLLASVGAGSPPAHSSWLISAVVLVRAAGGAWLIAWGAKGAPA